MHIEHIAMYVRDLEKVRKFFVTYFNAEHGAIYHNTKTNFRSYFLTFKDGAHLEIMTSPAIDNTKKSLTRTGFIHIAFSLGSKENVNSLTNKLRRDGYKVISEPRTTGDGYYESCVLDIEGNQIELTV